MFICLSSVVWCTHWIVGTMRVRIAICFPNIWNNAWLIAKWMNAGSPWPLRNMGSFLHFSLYQVIFSWIFRFSSLCFLITWPQFSWVSGICTYWTRCKAAAAASFSPAFFTRCCHCQANNLAPDHLNVQGCFPKPLTWNVLTNCSLNTLGVPVSTPVYFVTLGRARIMKGVPASLSQMPDGARAYVIGPFKSVAGMLLAMQSGRLWGVRCIYLQWIGFQSPGFG